MSAPNIIELAANDLVTASAMLSSPRSRVLALDVRRLAGGARCLGLSAAAFDTYCAAIDAGLARMRGLSSRGYELFRTPAERLVHEAGAFAPATEHGEQSKLTGPVAGADYSA